MSYKKSNIEKTLEKIKTYDETKEIFRLAKIHKKRTVLTNGCFDLIHFAHIFNLQESKELGQMLIVFVNSDASVREYKGPTRPIIGEKERCYTLAAFECVDVVSIFTEPDLKQVLRDMKPDVWTKGADYNLYTINQEERAIAENVGTKIEIVDNLSLQTISTSKLIERSLK